ncbi:hypothetical protein ACFYPZ_34890 [Streptomyces sp. NPDC005506]|uniref:hypothetical protein n=1 Tax=unclassified Streptomyces TaxID=2593676 RepID=UPI0036BAF097
MAIAEQEGFPARFPQISVDLLRVPDDRNLGLSARADFESRTSQYYGLLAQVVDSLPGWVGDLQGCPPTTPSQH